MATPIQRAWTPRQKIAAQQAAVDEAKAELVAELQAIVASAADYAEFQTDVAAWTASP